jgi:hypothetical protein
MRYVCLVYIDPERFAALDPQTRGEIDRDSGAYDVELDARGHLIAADALQSTKEAITIAVRDGKVTTTDGPFMETKEVLGGFILIEARDLNEAVSIGAGIPMARVGRIEVRPVMDFGGPRIGA